MQNKTMARKTSCKGEAAATPVKIFIEEEEATNPRRIVDEDEATTPATISMKEEMVMPLLEEENIPISAEEAAPALNADGKVTKKRQHIILKQKEMVINAFLMGYKVKDIGNIMGINNRTVYNIINQYQKTKQILPPNKGGHRKCIITKEIGEKLLDHLETNSTATLQEMREFLQSNFEIHLSRQTIANFLHGKLITRKLIRPSVVDRNCDYVKERRDQYVTRYLDESWSGKETIYIDESSFQLLLSRKIGRSKRSQPIYKTVPKENEKMITLLLAVSKSGPVHFIVVEGAINHDIYQKFVTELSQKLPGTKHYLIQDNAAIHRNTTPFSPLHQMVSLPPYSPFLNPIETFFSQVKSRVRAKISTSGQFANLTMAQRVHKMKSAIEEVLDDVSINISLKNHFKHIKTYFTRCLRRTDIL